MNDQQYDKLLHIHTIGNQKDFLMLAHYYPYEPTPYDVLDLCFDKIEFEKNDCFIDFGCGKGRVPFYVNHRFHIETLGIEMNESYVQHALQNKIHYLKEHQLENAPVNFLCAKAEQYKIQSTDNIFFFFNPFSIRIFRKVIHNILKSQQKNPRKMYVMLYYPSFEYIQFLQDETHFKVVKDVLVPNTSVYNIHERVMIFETEEELLYDKYME
ncbi:class I SAM-dependent methyltransferase [Rummeliibacillus pycnus]|uniref:class I SAM-dependent methyltransferase n=1 Tax=Rummeliibacillus pycnus TaxID=101070 RepID=UPI0037C984A0